MAQFGSFRREHFMRKTPHQRLERLADNIRSIRNYIDDRRHYEIVRCLFEETELFVRWLSEDTEHKSAIDLTEMEKQIFNWLMYWKENNGDIRFIERMKDLSREWLQALEDTN